MTSQTVKRLYLSREDAKLGGVCGGLGAYLGIDSTVVRVLWVVLSIFSLGVGVLLYLALWLIVPLAPQGNAHAQPSEPPPG